MGAGGTGGHVVGVHGVGGDDWFSADAGHPSACAVFTPIAYCHARADSGCRLLLWDSVISAGSRPGRRVSPAGRRD